LIFSPTPVRAGRAT